GVMSTIDDEDCFQFVLHEGDSMLEFSDNKPDRLPGQSTNVWPVIQLLNTTDAPHNQGFRGQVVRNLGNPGPGAGLTATTPSVNSNFSHFRARYTGVHMICWSTTTDVNAVDNPPASAYPLAWAGDIVINCGHYPGDDSADVSITKTGPVGPVQ